MLKPVVCLLCLSSCFWVAACSGVVGNHSRVGGNAGDAYVQARAVESSSSIAGITDSNAMAPTKKVQQGDITGVGIEHLFSLMQSERVLLVDCRPAIFYHLGHIQDSIHIPLKKYARLLNATKEQFDGAIAAGKIIVIYCQNLNCPDAFIFAKRIAAEGYSISVYKGGWEEWKASGL